MAEQANREYATVRIDPERVDSVIHTLEDLADIVDMEQREDLKMIHEQLMESDA